MNPINLKTAGRKIEMFRCQIDPMIGPTPRNAFVPSSLGMEAWVNEEATGIVVRMIETGTIHMIGLPNIQSMRLAPEEVAQVKRGPGRPPVHPEN